MKITDLQVTNVKGVSHVHIKPTDDPVVLVTGANGQGKSSTLDAIFLGLGGAAALRQVPEPIRQGEETAEVRIELGDGDDGQALTVVRRWYDGKTTLSVRDERDFKASSPQSTLDALTGAMTFDPLAWLRESDAKQRETLLAAVELPFDLDALEARRAETFDLRRDASRVVRTLEAQLAGMAPVPAGTPEQEISMADVLEELESAQALDGQVKDLYARSARADQDQRDANEEVERLRAALATAEARAERARQAAEEAGAAADAAPKVVDDDGRPLVEVAKERLGKVEEVNALVRAGQARAKVVSDLTAAQSAADGFTEALDEIDREKRAGLIGTDMPVEGMEIGDDAVLFQGRPLRQCSTSEQLRVSVATAMATNPKIRIVRIANGNDLDTASLQLVADMAEAAGYQVWIELVDETGERGFHIVEGELA